MAHLASVRRPRLARTKSEGHRPRVAAPIAHVSHQDAPPDGTAQRVLEHIHTLVQSQRDRFLTPEQVAEKLGVSRQTLWREVSGGRFMTPTHHFGTAPRWSEREIDRWIDGLIQARGER